MTSLRPVSLAALFLLFTAGTALAQDTATEAAPGAATEAATLPSAADEATDEAVSEASPAEPAQPGTAELERRIDVLAEEIERLRLGEAVVTADESRYGLGPAASKVYQSQPGISIGGYGEAVYENFAAEKDNGERANKTDRFDFLRNILYIGYKFDDKWVLNTEIEIEHVKEVYLEFAYVDYLYNEALNFRGGMVLLPVGLVNELHEPTIFLPTQRALTERVIIPTTWRENGGGIFGEVAGFSYRIYAVTGLNAIGQASDGKLKPNYKAGGLRSGRQKGADAKAEDWGFAARLDFVGINGLIAGVSAYQDQADQTKVKALEVGTRIVDAHLYWRWKGITLRGLAAQAQILNAAEYNENFGLTGTDSVGERLTGWYVECGYDVLSLFDGFEQSALTPYARVEKVDTQASVPSGGESSENTRTSIVTAGISFSPVNGIVLKADYQNQSKKSHEALDQFNAALGYAF